MHTTVILAVLTAASIAIGGCQSTTAKPDHAATWTSDKNQALIKSLEDYTLLPEFDRRSEEIGREIGKELVNLCLERSSEESLEECFHRHMLAAFDVDSVTTDRCPLSEDTEADFQCIVLSSFSYGLAKRAGGNALARFDWADLEASANAASIQIATAQVELCLAGSSASDPKDCVMAGVQKILGLSEKDLKPCEAIEEDRQFGECVGQAYGYKEFVTALARLRERSA